jgi:branched-chain amino acid transport system substrate-binding protein
LLDAIARAIKANGGRLPSRPEVVAAVAQTKDFAGVTGTYSLDENGDALSPMMSIYKVHDGRWEFVQVHKFVAP